MIFENILITSFTTVLLHVTSMNKVKVKSIIKDIFMTTKLFKKKKISGCIDPIYKNIYKRVPKHKIKAKMTYEIVT